ncbi:hypothetical protein K7I13_02295 [Brucepastera parasyntrophica]|nr:hypothetical protein K7I13_02295 [Brucepastera parasyntrophica]
MRYGRCTVFCDCYNANPDSMEKALGFVRDIDWAGEKILVLGSMLELGENSVRAHANICRHADSVNAAHIFLIGEEMIQAGRNMEWKSPSVRFCASIDELADSLDRVVNSDDLVFIKGSRGMALERIFPVLIAEDKI